MKINNPLTQEYDGNFLTILIAILKHLPIKNKKGIDGMTEEQMKAVKEIFYYDNTYTDKYLYFLLAKLKVNNTYDAYDALNKMRKKDKINLINSTIFQKLFDSENYREFIEDLYLHVTYKKRNKKNRINLQLWGE